MRRGRYRANFLGFFCRDARSRRRFDNVDRSKRIWQTEHRVDTVRLNWVKLYAKFKV